jgi:hypothetical protein
MSLSQDLIFFVMLLAVAMFFLDLRKSIKFMNLLSHLKYFILFFRGEYNEEQCLKNGYKQDIKSLAPPDIETLNCRVELTKQKQGNSVSDAFTISIRGSIHSPADSPEADVTLRVSIMDVTPELQRAEPVQGRSKQWQMGNSPAFRYDASLGRLPERITTLPEWTEVARLNIDWLDFPRKGRRNLQFLVSVLSQQNGQELARAKFNSFYINPKPGYMDVEENIQRTKKLTIALAFAVSAADGKLYNCEIETIKSWARGSFLKTQDAIHEIQDDKVCRKLEKALDRTVAFFRAGNQINTYAICKKIIEIAPSAARYDILALCLNVAKTKGFVTFEELTVLKDLAKWLEADMDRLRDMVEKNLPVDMLQVKDVEITLGLTKDMNKEATRLQLNKEYGKWNSRVTSPNPLIRAQAEHMLRLIAEARCQYIG